jgi:serine/threonine-protein kinase
MEYLAGETLARRLDRVGGLHWVTACLIGRRIADAIGAAHDKGIIHRDLKPENVFLLSDGDRPGPRDVRVLDFGLAKLRDGDLVGGLATRQGSLLGSPAYMSPEQCEGAPADHRSDVYSLGCMLFEIIAGRPPFQGKRLRQLLEAHRFRTPPALSAFASDVPPWLDEIVATMLAKSPDHRPPSMPAVVAVLDRAEDAEQGAAVTSAPREAGAAAPTQLRT